MLANRCVYTIKLSPDLIEALRAGGSGTFHERTRWATAKQLLAEARRSGERLPIVFAPAEGTDRLFGWALLEDGAVGSGRSTKYSFSALRQFKKRPLKSSLTKAKGGKHLDRAFIRPYAICRTPPYLEEGAPPDAPLDLPDEETLESLPKKSYEEGRRRFALHRGLERNRQLVRDAKRWAKMEHGGKLMCEVCAGVFEREYGERGRDFIEAHHRIPIAKIKKRTKLGVKDLAVVCANCHRMLHRLPWASVEELRSQWEELHSA